jgi:hypothetical protein
MRRFETPELEIRVLDDGLTQARRKDRQPLTDQDLVEARRLADSLPGITVADVMRVWPEAKVIRPTK